MKDLELASLLCSRLCHDLVSPVGAVSNGVEILKDETDPEMLAQVVELVEQSARQTSHRIQFFRIAFGAGGGFGSTIDVREAHKVLTNLLSVHNIDLDWVIEPKSYAKIFVKILLNLAFVVSESIVRGGQLSVHFQADEKTFDLKIRGTGTRLIMQEEVERALKGEVNIDELSPKASPAYLTHCLVAETKGKFQLDKTEEFIEVSVKI